MTSETDNEYPACAQCGAQTGDWLPYLPSGRSYPVRWRPKLRLERDGEYLCRRCRREYPFDTRTSEPFERDNCAPASGSWRVWREQPDTPHVRAFLRWLERSTDDRVRARRDAFGIIDIAIQPTNDP